MSEIKVSSMGRVEKDGVVIVPELETTDDGKTLFIKIQVEGELVSLTALGDNVSVNVYGPVRNVYTKESTEKIDIVDTKNNISTTVVNNTPKPFTTAFRKIERSPLLVHPLASSGTPNFAYRYRNPSIGVVTRARELPKEGTLAVQGSKMKGFSSIVIYPKNKRPRAD